MTQYTVEQLLNLRSQIQLIPYLYLAAIIVITYALLRTRRIPRFYFIFLTAAGTLAGLTLAFYAWKLAKCCMFVYTQLFPDSTQNPLYVQRFISPFVTAGLAALYLLLCLSIYSYHSRKTAEEPSKLQGPEKQS